MDVPISITICNNKEGYSLITKKRIARDTIIILNETLSEEQWMEFKIEIEGSYFWYIGVGDFKDSANIGLDGSNWTLEGRRKFHALESRKYHFVSLRSPKKGNFRNACLKLIQFSKLAKNETIY
jgi:hypothetical protein